LRRSEGEEADPIKNSTGVAEAGETDIVPRVVDSSRVTASPESMSTSVTVIAGRTVGVSSIVVYDDGRLNCGACDRGTM
jgi:hypothetical protein